MGDQDINDSEKQNCSHDRRVSVFYCYGKNYQIKAREFREWEAIR